MMRDVKNNNIKNKMLFMICIYILYKYYHHLVVQPYFFQYLNDKTFDIPFNAFLCHVLQPSAPHPAN